MLIGLRNRFLSTAAVSLRPDDGAGSGATDQGGNDDQGQQDAGQDDNGGSEGAGDQTTAAAEGGADEGGAGSDGDEDDDPLAGLSAEQRAKVEAHMQREIGWRDRQLARATAKRRNAEQDAEAARTIVEQTAPRRAASPPAGGYTEADIQREAQRLANQQQYDQQCNDTDSAGRKFYGDKWTAATDKLVKMGGLTQDDMHAVLATDNPAVVLYELSKNPDEYARVMALPPARRNTEFVKIGLKEPPKTSVPSVETKRPGGEKPPVRPIQGSRNMAAQRVDLYDDSVSDEDWYRERNATRRKKFSDAQ